MTKNILVAYIPVIHAGHIPFFQKYTSSKLFLLNNEVVSELEHLTRDMRALKAEQIKPLIEALQIFSEIEIAGPQKLKELAQSNRQIIMPDEEISRHLAKKYFSKNDIILEPTFLRWDMPAALSKKPPTINIQITEAQLHKKLIKKAFEETEKSPDWWRQIGALAVKNGEIILKAYNTHLPTEYSAYINGDPRSNFKAGEKIDLSLAMHAEASIVSQAAAQGISLKNCSIYVTTFPCPNCARLLSQTQIKKLYYSEGYSLLDAQEILKSANIQLIQVKKEQN